MKDNQTTNIQQKIQDLINENRVILFMKGTKHAPMCGFSSTVSQILHSYGIEFKDINVLEDPEIRQGIKDYSNWPTIPQLYIAGQFIGGCDIVVDLYQQGQLSELLQGE